MPVLVLPILNGQSLSTKDAILSILSYRWPLSVKEIHRIAKTEYGLTSTYQATHKMLNQLVDEKIVSKQDQKYSLDKNWVSKIKSFGEQVHQNYTQQLSFSEIHNKEIINVTVHSVVEVIQFIIHIFNDQFPNPHKKPRICMLEHAWLPAGLGESDWEQVKKIFQIQYYGLYKGDTPLDRLANSITAKLGKKSIHNVHYSADGDLVVEGDYIAQIFYPPEIRQKIDTLFKTVQPADDPGFKEAFDVYTTKANIKIVISKNPELAETLRNEGIKLYEKYEHGENKTYA